MTDAATHTQAYEYRSPLGTGVVAREEERGRSIGGREGDDVLETDREREPTHRLRCGASRGGGKYPG